MSASRRRLAALLAAAAVALAACGGGTATPSTSAAASVAPSTAASEAPSASPTQAPSQSPSPTASPSAGTGGLPTGGRTGRVDVEGQFAVTLADGWTEVPLSEDQIRQLVSQVQDPELAASLQEQLPTLLAAGVLLWAFDMTPGSEGGNLIVLAQPGEVPLATLKSLAQQSIAQVPGIEGNVSVDDVKIDGADGVVVSYKATQTTANGTLTSSGTQVYVGHGGRTYIFTFTDPQGGSESAIEEMIRSIELLG